MTKELIIPIGIPGCGKTTYYNTEYKSKGYYRVSPDEIRFAILNYPESGIDFDETKEEEVWNAVWLLSKPHSEIFRIF